MQDLDRDVLTFALGVDVQEFLQLRVAAGATNDAIVDEIATRTHGLVRLTAARLEGLLQGFNADREEVDADALTLEAAVGQPAGAYLRQMIKSGKSASHARREVIRLSGATIPIPRIVALIDRERVANGPYSKPKHADRKVATLPDESTKTAPIRPRRTRTQWRRAVGVATAEEPSRKGSAEDWIPALEAELDRALGESAWKFIFRRATIETAKGTPQSRMYPMVARALRARGGRLDLRPEDVRQILLRHGWKTVADREEEREWREHVELLVGRSKRAGAQSSQFWVRIATEPSIRQVSGGLPSLGKRS